MMGKGKPRHDPSKRANQRGGSCSHCEIHNDELWCIYEGKRGAAICKGNPHNCIKVSLRKIAGLSDIQRDNGVLPKGVAVNEDGNLYNPM